MGFKGGPTTQILRDLGIRGRKSKGTGKVLIENI
jgi:hypothetical protein